MNASRWTEIKEKITYKAQDGHQITMAPTFNTRGIGNCNLISWNEREVIFEATAFQGELHVDMTCQEKWLHVRNRDRVYDISLSEQMDKLRDIID